MPIRSRKRRETKKSSSFADSNFRQARSHEHHRYFYSKTKWSININHIKIYAKCIRTATRKPHTCKSGASEKNKLLFFQLCINIRNLLVYIFVSSHSKYVSLTIFSRRTRFIKAMFDFIIRAHKHTHRGASATKVSVLTKMPCKLLRPARIVL